MALKLKSTTAINPVQHSFMAGLPGAGKTNQARYFQEHYGPGLILDAEGGTRTISDIDVPVIKVTSWAGESDEEKGELSFEDAFAYLMDPGFISENNIKWVMIDSLTALSDFLMAEMEKKYKADKNGFKKFAEYGDLLTGAMRTIKSLPMHTITTALLKDEKDDNGNTDYWPAIQGAKAQKQIPGIFDNVYILRNYTERNDSGEVIDVRDIVLSSVGGYHGKIRTPYPDRFPSVIRTSNVVNILKVIDMPEDEYQKLIAKNQPKAEEPSK